MQIDITGNVCITEAMVDFISRKVSKLGRIHPTITNARVTVKVEKHHHEVSARFFDTSGKVILAKSKGKDAYEATDLMLDIACRHVIKSNLTKSRRASKQEITLY
ncbi:ribosome hibernation-promoting factor, HPF/YfiA family [Escherichia coli]|uniref:ribosome hibernation-promoting factor, HPF/YfiA family n=1 Tax=Escherichia coli TaxID=562 RepID=UPI000CFE092A|nr:ribosome-associated translation inhibitor RaiA [Escherichia coli]